MNKKSLYITYDGLSDPLGRSQIIPYLKIISQNRNLSVLSFEKEKNIKFLQEIHYELNSCNIKYFHFIIFNVIFIIVFFIDVVISFTFVVAVVFK